MKSMRQTNMVIWTVLLVVGLMLPPTFGQTEQDTQNRLATLGIYPYPSEDEVNDREFSSEEFSVSPLSADDINQDFSNLEDLTWLQPIATNHRVVLVGEAHYYQYIQHLRNRILFAFNTFDAYPTLIVEREYSKTPFLNYYLSLADEEEARQFEPEMQGAFVMESEYQLFQHLRRWNATHPDKKIQVGCSDIEHDYLLTFRHILLPYFQKLREACPSDVQRLQIDVPQMFYLLMRTYPDQSLHSTDELNAAFQPVERLLTLAKERRFVGMYPFIPPEYIETVIENLKSTYVAKTQGFRYRQQAIIRNLTDSRFLGNYFKTGKVIIHGGSYHTPIHGVCSEEQNSLREGCYFTYAYALTQGKTSSLFLQGFAFSFADITRLNGNRLGGGYQQMVNQIQLAHRQGLLSSANGYLVEPEKAAAEQTPFDLFTKWLIYNAYQHDHRPLLLNEIPWTALLTHAKQRSIEEDKILVDTQEWLQRHDRVIWVPISPLVISKN